MRKRVDLVLVDRGLVPSREKARALIQAGAVRCNNQPVTKPGQLVLPDAEFWVDKTDLRWVSRGGLKLDHALKTFALPSVQDMICLDLGASTGGFTDVLLSYGAACVYAVDVGHGQLDPRLAANPKVINLEKTHARDITSQLISWPLDLVVCDVSFISVTKALGPSLSLVRPGGWLVSLIKPQFEAGRAALGKGGVVKDPADRQRAIELVRTCLDTDFGWQVHTVTDSPVTGPDGNHEYLMCAQKPDR